MTKGRKTSFDGTRFAMIAAGALGFLASTPVAAQDAQAPGAEVIEAVEQCREIPDGEQRLACYDRTIAAFSSARKNDEIFVASREELDKARRGLFGLRLPRLRIFDGKEGESEIKEITAKIASVSAGSEGWVFKLENDSVWYQSEVQYIRRPSAGDTIAIRRAALGNYFAQVNGGLGFRIRRAE